MSVPIGPNNQRIRQLIAQFNAEEEYDFELRSACVRLAEKFPGASERLLDLLAALNETTVRVARPPVEAIGIWMEGD